jgi:hypothetical protein
MSPRPWSRRTARWRRPWRRGPEAGLVILDAWPAMRRSGGGPGSTSPAPTCLRGYIEIGTRSALAGSRWSWNLPRLSAPSSVNVSARSALGSCPLVVKSCPPRLTTWSFGEQSPGRNPLDFPQSNSWPLAPADQRRTCAMSDEPFALLGERDAPSGGAVGVYPRLRQRRRSRRPQSTLRQTVPVTQRFCPGERHLYAGVGHWSYGLLKE